MHLSRRIPYLLLLGLLLWALLQAVQINALAEDAQALAADMYALQSQQTALRERISKPLPITCEPQELILEPAGELLTPCGLTAQELENSLLDGLKPYAEDFILAEQETGVNAVFLAAVAALESGWASSRAAEEKNNLFGWTGADGYMAFDSREECISCVAVSIKELYLSPDGPYFNGYMVEDLNVRYNGRTEWEQEVRQIMSEILARSVVTHELS